MQESENTGPVEVGNMEQEAQISNKEPDLEELAEQIVLLLRRELELERYRSGN